MRTSKETFLDVLAALHVSLSFLSFFLSLFLSFFLSFFLSLFNNISTGMPSSAYSFNVLVVKRWELNQPSPPLLPSRPRRPIKSPVWIGLTAFLEAAWPSGLGRWNSTWRTRVQIPLWPVAGPEFNSSVMLPPASWDSFLLCLCEIFLSVFIFGPQSVN